MKLFKCIALPALCVIIGAAVASASGSTATDPGSTATDPGVICYHQVGDQNLGECTACCNELAGPDQDDVRNCWDMCRGTIPLPDEP